MACYYNNKSGDDVSKRLRNIIVAVILNKSLAYTMLKPNCLVFL